MMDEAMTSAMASPILRRSRPLGRLPIILSGLGVWAGLFAPTPAWAHGRFPEAGQVVIDPSDDDRIWVRTTYGIITTDDGGGEWRWICPDGVGFEADKEDPPVAIMGDGTALVGTFDGLSVSADGCDFTFPSLLEGRYVIDLFPEAGYTSAVAVSSNGLAADTFEVKLFDTGDNGQTWTEIGTSPPNDFLALTLGLAPSDPQRLYLTGRDGTAGAYQGVLQRSEDRGETWARVTIPGTEGADALPYMGGVDPNDADRLYLAVIERDMGEVISFVLLFSDDGGDNWTSIFEREEQMAGFALSPDGQNVAVGGKEAGLFLASTEDHAFSKINEISVRCLTWVESGLYACADQFTDGYNVALSTDAGETFSGISQMGSPCGPPVCGETTSVGETCPGRWPEEKLELDAQDCDAGTGGAGTGGGGATNAGDDGGGCGCHAPGSSRPARARWWSLVGLALAVSARRLRRRR
jgi:photosystem II stability/assembly factor-like uncharacterized protein